MFCLASVDTSFETTTVFSNLSCFLHKTLEPCCNNLCRMDHVLNTTYELMQKESLLINSGNFNYNVFIINTSRTIQIKTFDKSCNITTHNHIFNSTISKYKENKILLCFEFFIILCIEVSKFINAKSILNFVLFQCPIKKMCVPAPCEVQYFLIE